MRLAKGSHVQLYLLGLACVPMSPCQVSMSKDVVRKHFRCDFASSTVDAVPQVYLLPRAQEVLGYLRASPARRLDEASAPVRRGGVAPLSQQLLHSAQERRR